MPVPQGPVEGTKFSILQLLLRQELTPAELARRLDITPTAVRQHLATLAALGLVERRRVPAGPSRPPEMYRLSADGRRIFPKRYDLLVAGLLEVLLERIGADRTLEAVADAARRLAERVTPELGGGGDAQRWTRLLAWLEQEFAWEADALRADGTPGRLIIHQCPFQDVSSRHPAVCGVFFSSLIEALQPGTQLEHAPDAPGEACCAFVVKQKVEEA
jgi:DeoR family transcriptional regulator, suf operon transcriptional repressor